MIDRLVPVLTAFRDDRRGNVAVIFAVTLLPLVLLIGGAVDISLAGRARTALDTKADTALLAAVGPLAMALSAADAKTQVEKVFADGAKTVTLLRSVSSTVTVTDGPDGRTAVLRYDASVPTAFLGVLGWDTLLVAGTATSQASLPSYIDFYLLLDNTPSMGVGATLADIKKLVDATANKPSDSKCAFACHDTSNADNYYNLAKRIGATMRIDVVRTATQTLMDKAETVQRVPNQFRMAIYTFGSSATAPGLTKIFSLSSGLSSAKTAAGAIDLMTIPRQNYDNDQQTDFNKALTAIGNDIPAPGNGVTPEAPQKYLFFVSDGVADYANASGCRKRTTDGVRCQEPLNTAICTTLKNRGIKIAVVYTTYLDLPTNDWYMTWIKPFNPGPYEPSDKSEIAKAMKDCASSPDLYAEAGVGGALDNAMTKLFEKAVQSARLTR